jgi:hypothetical protein
MSLLLIALGIIAGGAALGRSDPYYGGRDLIGFGMSALAGIFALFCGIALIVAQVNSPATVAYAHALRQAAHDIGPDFGHDIYGRVADYNAAVLQGRYWRHRRFSRDFTEACYDTLTEIPLPAARAHERETQRGER